MQSRLRDILVNPAYGCLVAEKESQILGFIDYTKRQGIATALMDKVKKIASQDGANDERLAAHAQNYVFRQTSLAFARNVEEDEHGKEKS